MGLYGSDSCECGKVQTAHHILHDCTKFIRPCHINEVITLLFWNTLPNQSSDQNVFLFVYTKEEELLLKFLGMRIYAVAVKIIANELSMQGLSPLQLKLIF